MQSINTTLGTALTDTTRRSFSLGYAQERMGGRALFDVQPTDKKVEVFNQAVSDDFAHETGDGENFYENESVYGDELTMTQAKMTASTEITSGIQMYDQYAMVDAVEGSQSLGRAHSNKIEMDIQQWVGNGASTSYTDIDGNTVSTLCADGLAPFSSLHTQNGSSATYDNLDSTAFGQTGIETGENLFRLFLNHDAQRSNKIANIIFSTGKPSLVNLIKEYRNATGHVEDASRGLNAYMGKYDSIVLEYMDTTSSGANDATKDDYWGLAVRKARDLRFRVSKNPIIHEPRITERSRNLLMQSESWYAVGIENPDCIMLHQA